VVNPLCKYPAAPRVGIASTVEANARKKTRKTASQRMLPLAPLCFILIPIAKAFTTSTSELSSSSFKIYRKQSGIKRIWKNETKYLLLMPDPFCRRGFCSSRDRRPG
jgi:hypothetical protein